MGRRIRSLGRGSEQTLEHPPDVVRDRDRLIVRAIDIHMDEAAWAAAVSSSLANSPIS